MNRMEYSTNNTGYSYNNLKRKATLSVLHVLANMPHIKMSFRDSLLARHCYRTVETIILNVRLVQQTHKLNTKRQFSLQYECMENL